MARRQATTTPKETTTTTDTTEERPAPLNPAQIPSEGLSGAFEGTFNGVGKSNNRPFTIHNIGGQGVWGSKTLDTLMASVEEGDEVTLMYDGKEEKTGKKGAYKQHKFRLV